MTFLLFVVSCLKLSTTSSRLWKISRRICLSWKRMCIWVNEKERHHFPFRPSSAYNRDVGFCCVKHLFWFSLRWTSDKWLFCCNVCMLLSMAIRSALLMLQLKKFLKLLMALTSFYKSGMDGWMNFSQRFLRFGTHGRQYWLGWQSTLSPLQCSHPG